MARKTGVTFNNSSLFGSTVVKRLTGEASSVKNKTAAELSGALSPGEDTVFRYDAPGSGLKSTQQIPIDWSKLENHTFFNSAEAKVNVAFDEIINHYPFDGAKAELIKFLDGLTGYEKYVFDNFPVWKGFLHFSGTAVNENPASGYTSKLGTYVKVEDFAGNLFPGLSKDKTGKSVLNPGKSSISFEFKLFVPTGSNTTQEQVVLQKINGNSNGITVGLSGSSPINTTAPLMMMITSGTAYLSASMDVNKGAWNHVCATYNRKPGKNRIELFLNSNLVSTSNAYDMETIEFNTSPLLIGSGTTHVTSSAGSFLPQQTLSGAMDELRIFHDVRSTSQQSINAQKNIYPEPISNLKLYFKFNEPTGSYTSNNVLIDGSGNSLHSKVTNFSTSLREKKGLTIPLTMERNQNNPVLFPDFPGVTNFNSGLLSEAVDFDVNNPNIITGLIPKHYLLDASIAGGFEGENADVGDAYSNYAGESMPGGGKIGSPQLVGALLYTWAKFFDEIKLYLDQASNILHVDYDTDDTVASQFLPFLANHYGLQLPNQFANASIDQLLDGENLTADAKYSAKGVQYVQNQIWRRILINLKDILRSKGTIHSIKALMRSAGLNPDNNFRFREYGGPATRELAAARRNKTETAALLDMSGSLAQYTTPTLNSQGVGDNVPLLQSGYLSSSRVEIGFPIPSTDGSFVDVKKFPPNGIFNRPSDGLLTSGSWTYEGLYKFESSPLIPNHLAKQSLARIHSTGSGNPQPVLANLIALSPSDASSTTGSLRLYVRAGASSSNINSSPVLCFSLNDVNIFDGNKWYVSFGRERNDEIESVASSSYFIRAGRQSWGEMIEFKSASALFLEDVATLNPGGVWTKMSSGYNASGSFIVIGSQSIGTSTSGYFLNSVSNVTDANARYTNFSGRVGQVRWWSKALSNQETSEHIKNFKSVGVDNPLVNFNFEKVATGSFGRLRFDASIDQPVTKSTSTGKIIIKDFSQNNLYFSGSGFQFSTRVVKPERFDFSMLDPKFDEAGTTNKIRIRSWKKFENVEKFGGGVAPISEIMPSEKPTDDTRFAIEISSVQALDEDMINIFSTLEIMDNALGAPELLFSTEYPELRNMREIYFNRLTDKVNFKSFFEFFKWFDDSLGILIERLVPSKTNFLGVNYVIESHMLERAKFHYNYGDVYLGENNRHGLKGVILMRQIVGTLKRY